MQRVRDSKKLSFFYSAGFVAALLICGFLFAAYSFFALQDIDELRATANEFLTSVRGTRWAFPVIIGLYLLSGFVMFPVMVLNLATAFVFGPVQGFLYSLSGILLNAVLFFHIGRFGRNRGLKKYLEGPRLGKIDEKLHNAGVAGVTLLRLVPLAPFSIFNMAAGVTSLRFFDFIAGTFLAFWPGGISRAVLGDSLMQLFFDPSVRTALYVAIGFLLWAVIVLGVHFGIKKYQQERH